MTQMPYPIEFSYDEKATSQPRCYVTFTEEPELVCHHCGRGISPAHKNFTVEDGWKIWKKDVFWKKKIKAQQKAWNKKEFTKSRSKRLLHALPFFKDYEFRGLDLKPEEAIHCEDCLHDQLKFILLGLFLGVMFLAALLSFAYAWFIGDWSLGFLGILAIVLTTALFLVIWQDYQHHHRLSSFPIQGRSPLIKIDEVLTGKIMPPTGEEGHGILLLGSHGTLEFSMKMANVDRKRFKKYEEKYKRLLSRSCLIEQSAGFILYKLINRIDYEADDVLLSKRINTIAIQKKARMAELSARMEAEYPEAWETTFTYEIELPSSEQEKLPIEIVPMIVVEDRQHILGPDIKPERCKQDDESENVGRVIEVESDDIVVDEANDSLEEVADGEVDRVELRRALIFDIQVNTELNNDGLKTAVVEIESLRLLSAADYGRADITNYPAVETNEGIVWEKVELEGGNDCVKRRRMYVRFDKRVERGDLFSGEMVLKFKNTAVSGMDNVAYYNSLGYPIDAVIKKNTKLTVDFSFVVNDEIQVEYDSYTPEPIHQGIIPDYQMVTELVSGLGEDGSTYIQRVIENPPRTNRADAMKINRVWDIAGRKYIHDFLPIDFHIVIMGWVGYERHNDEPVRGQTTFKIHIEASPIMEDVTIDIENEVNCLIQDINACITDSVNDAIERATEEQKVGILLETMKVSFNIEELKTLCQLLLGDYENFFENKGKSAFVREIIRESMRRDELQKLIDYCRQKRPNSIWPEI